MIGDADLDIQRDANSTPWLTDLVSQAATNLGYQSHFFQQTVGMDDDHIPFAKVGVPVVDLIDYTYGYNNVFHHTPDDTVDKLSAQSHGHHRRRGDGDDRIAGPALATPAIGQIDRSRPAMMDAIRRVVPSTTS